MYGYGGFSYVIVGVAFQRWIEKEIGGKKYRRIASGGRYKRRAPIRDGWRGSIITGILASKKGALDMYTLSDMSQYGSLVKI